jgi:hypothetical protein
MKRRSFIRQVGLYSIGAALPAAWPRLANAQSPEDRRLQNRLELWGNYARRTENLAARYVCERHSSLLYEPLVRTGSLAFAVPDTLTLKDDGLTGSTTRMRAGEVSIRPNESSVPPGPEIDPAALPGMAWLRDRMVALFAPGDASTLVAQSRTRVPKSRTPRLELLPITGSAVRKLLRSLTITFDPVGGAVIKIVISEAQGDIVELKLSDHRQNIDGEELARLIE